ncbi:hypothetical protein KFE25_003870 [Diacronema lutheri]|uniref:Uncharacterized protein n=1 Tax=Diacronema lutheri TaxID=2081491 RepID=A0A8J6C6I8_DIALT|nr:hypothetical protein KFE25_003870 [Diacronema lutheri]
MNFAARTLARSLPRAARATTPLRRPLCTAPSAPTPAHDASTARPERWPFAESAERREALDAAIADLRAEGEQYSAARQEGVQVAGALHAFVRAPWSYLTSAAYREQARETAVADASFLLHTLDELLGGVDDVYIQLADDWADGDARLAELEGAGALEAEVSAALRAKRAAFADAQLLPFLRMERVSTEIICLDSDTTWSHTTAHVLVHSTQRFAAVPMQPDAAGSPQQPAVPSDAHGAGTTAAAARARAAAAAAAQPAMEQRALLTFAGRWHSFGHYLRWVRAMRIKATDGGALVDATPHPIEWSLRDVNLLVTLPADEPAGPGESGEERAPAGRRGPDAPG